MGLKLWIQVYPRTIGMPRTNRHAVKRGQNYRWGGYQMSNLTNQGNANTQKQPIATKFTDIHSVKLGEEVILRRSPVV